MRNHITRTILGVLAAFTLCSCQSTPYDEPYSTKNNSLFMFYNTYGYDVDYLQRIRTFGDFTVSGSTLMLTVYKNRGSDFDIYE